MTSKGGNHVRSLNDRTVTPTVLVLACHPCRGLSLWGVQAYLLGKKGVTDWTHSAGRFPSPLVPDHVTHLYDIHSYRDFIIMPNGRSAQGNCVEASTPCSLCVRQNVQKLYLTAKKNKNKNKDVIFLFMDLIYFLIAKRPGACFMNGRYINCHYFILLLFILYRLKMMLCNRLKGSGH